MKKIVSVIDDQLGAQLFGPLLCQLSLQPEVVCQQDALVFVEFGNLLRNQVSVCAVHDAVNAQHF